MPRKGPGTQLGEVLLYGSGRHHLRTLSVRKRDRSGQGKNRNHWAASASHQYEGNPKLPWTRRVLSVINCQLLPNRQTPNEPICQGGSFSIQRWVPQSLWYPQKGTHLSSNHTTPRIGSFRSRSCVMLVIMQWGPYLEKPKKKSIMRLRTLARHLHELGSTMPLRKRSS